MTRRRGLWLALFGAALFGLGGAVVADTFATVPPLEVGKTRSIITALVFGAIAYRRRLASHHGRLPVLIGFGFIMCAVIACNYLAIARLGVGPGVTIQFLGPVLVLCWMSLVQRRHVPAGAWLAAAVAMGGVALMSRPWQFERLDPLGVSAALAAAVLFASYLIVGERLGKGLHPLTSSAYAFAFASIVWLVLLPGLPAVPDIGTWLEIIGVALLGTALPFLMQMSALRAADPGSVGVVISIEPAVAAGAAWLLLGQALEPVQIAGAIATTSGVAAMQWVVNRG